MVWVNNIISISLAFCVLLDIFTRTWLYIKIFYNFRYFSYINYNNLKHIDILMGLFSYKFSPESDVTSHKRMTCGALNNQIIFVTICHLTYVIQPLFKEIGKNWTIKTLLRHYKRNLMIVLSEMYILQRLETATHLLYWAPSRYCCATGCRPLWCHFDLIYFNLLKITMILKFFFAYNCL